MSLQNPEKALESRVNEDQVAQGLLIALSGFACLSIGDGVIKSIAGEWPGTAVAALRYSFGAFGLLLMVLLIEGPKGLRCPMPWAQLGRGVAVAIATLAFFTAIFLMPLADATAIQFTSPMITALFSAMLLGERMPKVAWIATLIAFGGVMLVLRPSVGALGWAAILPVIAAIGISLMMVFNRMVAQAGSALLMQLLISVIAAPILVFAAVVGHFSGVEALRVPVPDWTIVARCALVAVTASFSHWLIYLATTKASAAVTAPMVYVQLLIAVLIGVFFYADYPDPLAMAGAALIIGAGLWLWNRQRRRIPAVPA